MDSLVDVCDFVESVCFLQEKYLGNSIKRYF